MKTVTTRDSGSIPAGNAHAAEFLALLALCSAYIQGPLTKALDFQGAIAEMNHFGLPPAPFFAIAVPIFELAMSALILSGRLRWLGALALAVFTLMATYLALRFWEIPAGPEHSAAMNGFFEHVGLSGAFVFVALNDLRSRCLDDWRRHRPPTLARQTRTT
ncbi:DoxX family protein [Allorhizobium taibaishanense]|uniref:DoxX family protein n=1 Tax=Allorhizobium taibaishanense TaxID=887144 RepID=A0A1Q8ZYF0_9HYPH|nr:DoxX family protein [Allorhizobium taibaishanense]MBB4008089.1 putative membrane protein YphA (DoxX/SURF4 family) [Allorhizobium taibaishanense]OLP47100.1 DoxX family protein [Allorhizobium taibaishanense]